MPKLADTLVEGTVAKWLKAVGDTVAAGEPLCEIETDKVTTEMSSPVAGTVLELPVSSGRTVPVGAVIARIGAAGSAAQPAPGGSPADRGEAGAAAVVEGGRAEAAVPDQEATPASRQAPTIRAAETAASPTPAGAGEAASPPDRVRTTSLAARLLAEHGVAAAEVAAAAGGRRVRKEDVLRFVQDAAQPPATGKGPAAGSGAGQTTAISNERVVSEAGGKSKPYVEKSLTSMRRAIAEHMAKARATIPHGQTVIAADLTELVAWREREKGVFQAHEGAPLTLTVLFVAALGRAVRAAGPGLGLTVPASLDLGVAVAVPSGLIVPVLRGVDRISLGETARALNDVAERARANRLAFEETQGAFMTLTNVGSFGNLTAFPIVPLGQAGILGPGIVQRRPVARDGAISVGHQCLLALVFDRRLLNDLAADRLLRAVERELAAIPVVGGAATLSSRG